VKLTLSVLIAGLSGSAGDVTTAVWKGRPYARRRVIPANPQSAAQVIQRGAFSRMVSCFQSLPSDVKEFLDTLGAALRMSGYNVNMKDGLADERDSHGHGIVPPNRFADSVSTLVVAAGALTKEIEVTWSAGDYIESDTFDIYYREKESEGDEYTTGWVQYDTSAGDMADESITLTMPKASTDYMIAFVPYDTSETAFGGGDFGNATSHV